MNSEFMPSREARILNENLLTPTYLDSLPHKKVTTDSTLTN